MLWNLNTRRRGQFWSSSRVVIALATLLAMPSQALSLTKNPQAVTLDQLCLRQANQLLQKTWHSQNDWRPVFSPVGHIKTFRSPSDTLGIWLEKVEVSGQIVQVAKITPEHITQIRFDDQCHIKSAQIPMQPPPPYSHLVTDAIIQQTVATAKPGIIYVWSPHMQISILGLLAAQHAAAKVGIEMLAVLSKESSLDYAEQANKLYHLHLNPILQHHAVELSMRNLEQHLPSFVMFKDGKILSKTYRGYEDQETYEKIFRDYLASPSFN